MSGREKGKTSIRTALQQRDATLYHRLETIWTAIAREIQERQLSKEGHQQGPLHCGMVEDNLGKLILDDQKSNFFTPLELFLFSAVRTAAISEVTDKISFKCIMALDEKFYSLLETRLQNVGA